MLKTLRNALKIEELRGKIFYSFLMLIVVRLGASIPVPGVNIDVFGDIFAQTGGALSMFSAFTGGNFEQLSIFALGVSPYITSSIIVQLLTIAIPKLEELQKEGEDGRKKIAEITRYVTIALALVESTAMSIGFGNRGFFLEGNFNFAGITIAVVSLTAGSAFLMWVGERITEKGVGNGISIILMINILSRIPSEVVALYNQFVKGKAIHMAILALVIIILVILLTVVFVLLLNDGQRKIPVQYAKKMQGRKMVGGQSTHIPLKVNTAGVIPIIFASSLMSFPTVIASFAGKGNGTGVGATILKMLNQQNWFNYKDPLSSVGVIIYIILVVFFAYFYTSITFNPIEVADNMKKQGGFIPGIRPGKPTTEYLTKILNYLIFMGAVGLLFVAFIPMFFNGMFGASVSFGGTSLIIVVGVILETLKQIESQMLVRNYRGFLND
ncbi:MAG TPA: preprotein translocase subunit SecY [Candidatus Merdenecus merdavium]|nr:preprotein translocase subunit SecY [Candidatus Merdenecus merdavium]